MSVETAERTLLDQIPMIGDELLDHAPRETQLTAAVHLHAPGTETPHPPPRYGLRRNVELLADLFQGQHRLDGLFDRDGRDRSFQPSDEQCQIVPELVA